MLIPTSALLCLALNIYHEAGIDPIEGQMAVGFVTLNRAYKKEKSLCDVVLEPKQFSWTNNALDSKGRIKKKFIPYGIAWTRAKQVSKLLLSAKAKDFTYGATHYYADYINKPYWAYSMSYKGRWGTHHFYKEY